jgi:hypothetical protein
LALAAVDVFLSAIFHHASLQCAGGHFKSVTKAGFPITLMSFVVNPMQKAPEGGSNGNVQPSKATFLQQQKRGGLLVTDELDKALQECSSRVAEIAKDCREKNMKFRCVKHTTLQC